MSRFPHACTAIGVSVALCGLFALPVAPAVADPINDAPSASSTQNSAQGRAPDSTNPAVSEDSTLSLIHISEPTRPY